MKQLSILIAGLSILMLSSCINFYQADGPIETRNYSLSGFEGIILKGSADVFIYKGDEFSVEVTTHSDLFEMLNLFTVDGVLNLGFKNGFNSVDFNKLQYKITLPELHYLSVKGSGDIQVMDNFNVSNDFAMTVDGSGDIMALGIIADRIFADVDGSGSIITTDIDCQIFDTHLNGSGKIRTQGYARKQNMNINGSGSITTDYLESLETYIEINGSGTCKVWTKEYLNIRVLGSGRVYFYGEPEVNMHINGSGKVIQLFD